MFFLFERYMLILVLLALLTLTYMLTFTVIWKEHIGGVHWDESC